MAAFGAADQLADPGGDRFSPTARRQQVPYREVSADRVVLPSGEWRALCVAVAIAQGLAPEAAEDFARDLVAAVLRAAGWRPAGGGDAGARMRTQRLQP